MIPNDEYVSKTDLLNWLEESKHAFDNVEDNEYAYKSLILRTFDCVNHWVGNMKAVRHCGMDWAYCDNNCSNCEKTKKVVVSDGCLY